MRRVLARRRVAQAENDDARFSAHPHLHAETRRALETDDAHVRLRGTPLEREMLSPEALDASLEAALASPHARGDVWLFAYGSLIWNPAIEYIDRRVATAHGFHRQFCLWSRLNRGTPERPGLVLALERGGCCHGVVYRIRGAIARQELRLLWRREMMLGSYQPRWLSISTTRESLRALGFVINHARSGYAGKLPDERVIDVLRQAHGRFGSGLAYLRDTVAGLAASGVPDHRLERLAMLAAARGL